MKQFVAVLGARDSVPVDGKYWMQPYLQWAGSEGIVGGYANGSLHPHSTATRAHMSKILITAMDAFGI